MVVFLFLTSYSMEKKVGVFIPPPKNLTVASQKVRLKPASRPAKAGLKNPALLEIAGQIAGLVQRRIAPSEIGQSGYSRSGDRLKPAFLANFHIKPLPEHISTISSIIFFGQ
jgi:hypothetical protein